MSTPTEPESNGVAVPPLSEDRSGTVPERPPYAESSFSLKRSRLLFDTGNPRHVFVPREDGALYNASIQRRSRRRRGQGRSGAGSSTSNDANSRALVVVASADGEAKPEAATFPSRSSSALTTTTTSVGGGGDTIGDGRSGGTGDGGSASRILVQRPEDARRREIPTPNWHAPWKLSTVLSSHLGWVRSIATDPTNTLLATGSADRTIKIFDLPSACVGSEDALKITLTGHISPVRGLAFSSRHPYLFSAGEDKQVKCWDLETNQVVRHYHGHLSGVYCLDLHPTLDLLVTGGRDAVARVWDMRTKVQLHTLAGHDHTVSDLFCQKVHPQIVTSSHDCTIKMWDLVAGKCYTTLTHHSKAVRALSASTRERTFCSGAADSIRKWQGKDGRFIKSLRGHRSIINCLAMNDDGVMVSGGDDGTMHFWDYDTGYKFQISQARVQPGSLAAENAIYACAFDGTGTRLITGEADKTIKIWKQDEEASEMTHPINMKAWRKQCIKEAKERY